MPAHRKFDDRVSFTFQVERASLRKLRQKAKKRHIPLSDLLNERLKNLLSHVISLVK